MKRIKYIVLMILTLFVFISSNNINLLNASVNKYTNVLDDLISDSDFNIEDYPSMTLEECESANQELIEVIQIAESTSDELYVYVYQPTHNNLDLQSTKISISFGYSSNGKNLNPFMFDLELVSTYSVFDKYIVKDYSVNDETYRYYNIVTIYREYNSLIDDAISGTEEELYGIGHSVGQQWLAYYLNDELCYEMGTFETLEVEIIFCEFLNFNNGFKLGNLLGYLDKGQAWFVCFNVDDYIVKHIYDADLTYQIRDVTEKWVPFVGNDISYGEWSEHINITLTDNDEVTYQGSGFLAKEYKWNRISSSSDFLTNMESQNVTMKDETIDALHNSQWTFAFLETETSTTSSDTLYMHKYSDISNVGILRLHFVDITNKTYDLGVVTDLVNPDNISGGYGGLDFSLDKLEQLLGLFVLIALLILFSPLISLLVKIIWQVLKFVITLPFKIIKKKR